MVRLSTVNNDVRNSPAGSQKRNVCGWINRKRGSETNHQVTFCGGRFCLVQIATPKVLTETDRRRLQKASTMTYRWLAIMAEKLEM
jgi:hypothetical protein